MSKRLIYVLLLIVLMGCEEKETKDLNIINDSHLDHLYESWEVDGVKVGGIWIYCEAPDYHLVSDEDEGFTCIDDVARSLVFYCKQYEISKSEKLRRKIKTLSAFILHLQNANGLFYNFVFPDKLINKTHQNSVAEANWWSWRAFWALSEVLKLDDIGLEKVQKSALGAMEKLLPHMLTLCLDGDATFNVDGITSPLCAKDMGGDQIGLVMICLANYYEVNSTTEIKEQLLRLGDVLLKTQLGDESNFPFGAFLSWQNIWHAWGNSQAYAMLRVGRLLDVERFIDSGIKEVDFFYPYFLDNWPSHFKIGIENDSTKIIEQADYPQIAYNLRPMIYASLEAYDIARDIKYAEQAAALGNWFLGENQSQSQMYDSSTGRTYDGIISAQEINPNSGAESTIEALLSLQAISEYPSVLEKLKVNLKD